MANKSYFDRNLGRTRRHPCVSKWPEQSTESASANPIKGLLDKTLLESYFNYVDSLE
jgi:hypothetical protein